jgi:hypothetical protein
MDSEHLWQATRNETGFRVSLQISWLHFSGRARRGVKCPENGGKTNGMSIAQVSFMATERIDW